MFNISNKGGSDFLRRALVNYIIFFIFLGIIISFGAGRFITSDVVVAPPEPVAPTGSFFTALVNGLSWVADNIYYFFDLFSLSVNLQIFTGIIMTPFLVILIMFIIETIRGH